MGCHPKECAQQPKAFYIPSFLSFTFFFMQMWWYLITLKTNGVLTKWCNKGHPLTPVMQNIVICFKKLVVFILRKGSILLNSSQNDEDKETTSHGELLMVREPVSTIARTIHGNWLKPTLALKFYHWRTPSFVQQVSLTWLLTLFLLYLPCSTSIVFSNHKSLLPSWPCYMLLRC